MHIDSVHNAQKKWVHTRLARDVDRDDLDTVYDPNYGRISASNPGAIASVAFYGQRVIKT